MSDTIVPVEPRMGHVVSVLPGAMGALQALAKAARDSGVPETTAYLVQLRASQINGCSFCAEMHSRELRQAGVRDEKLWTVGAWREAPYFTDAERAALALTEALTRLSDRPEAVTEEIFDEAARHYDEQELAGLILEIASINVWNRINVAVRQPAGAWS